MIPPTTWRSVLSCRDITRWLEGAGHVLVYPACVQVESAASGEAVTAAATFVGIRLDLLAKRRCELGWSGDRATLRSSVSLTLADRPDPEGLIESCLQLILDLEAGQPVTQLAERLEAYGFFAVLEVTGFAQAIGTELVTTPSGYPTYRDLYVAEDEWMARIPRASDSGA